MAKVGELTSMIKHSYLALKGKRAPDVGGFNVFYQDKNLLGYINPHSNVMVLAWRGTADKRDVLTDAQILSGREDTARSAEGIRKARELIKDMKPRIVYFVGHSLGANVAWHSFRANDRGKDIFAGFNGFIPGAEWLMRPKGRAFSYRTSFDPVSVKAISGSTTVKPDKITVGAIHGLESFRKIGDKDVHEKEGTVKEPISAMDYSREPPKTVVTTEAIPSPAAKIEPTEGVRISWE